LTYNIHVIISSTYQSYCAKTKQKVLGLDVLEEYIIAKSK